MPAWVMLLDYQDPVGDCNYVTKTAPFVAVACAALLSASPAHPHGDELHGTGSDKGAALETATSIGNMNPSSARPSGQGIIEGIASVDGQAERAGHDESSAENGSVLSVFRQLHPASVHFPIGLLLMATLTEFMFMSRRSPERDAAVRIMIFGGAAGTLVAAAFGWVHTGLWFGGDTVMHLHRWNGMLLIVLGAIAAKLAYDQNEKRTGLRILLASIAVLVIAQGFLGGELAHGPDHLGI